MPRVRRPLRQPDDRGFILVELLVVMIVLGILAAIAVPAFLGSRREAYETSAKSDVKQITREVLALYVDGSGELTVRGRDGTWEIRRLGQVVATGRLSPHNEVSSTSSVTNAGAYCLSVRNTRVDAEFWTSDDGGLRAGDCSPGS